MVVRQETGTLPMSSPSYLEGFRQLEPDAKMYLDNNSLFDDQDGNTVTPNTLNALYRAAQNSNDEAVSLLMQYTCHTSEDVRSFAKDRIGELYKESPRLVGEIAGEFVKVLTSAKEAKARTDGSAPKPDLFESKEAAFVGFLSAKYERRNGNTGDSPYRQAVDLIQSFMNDHQDFIVEDQAEDILASNRLVLHDELGAHTKSLKQTPVEHSGVYRLDHAEDLDALVKKISSEDAFATDRKLVAAVRIDDHFVSVVASGGEIAILDTLWREGREWKGERLKTVLAERMPDARIESVFQDLQGIRSRHEVGLPNGCGIINLELHQWLSDRFSTDSEAMKQPADKLLRDFAESLDGLSTDKEQSLSDIHRLKLFSSRADTAAKALEESLSGATTPTTSTVQPDFSATTIRA